MHTTWTQTELKELLDKIIEVRDYAIRYEIEEREAMARAEWESEQEYAWQLEKEAEERRMSQWEKTRDIY